MASRIAIAASLTLLPSLLSAESAPVYQVTKPPAELKLDSFYAKHVYASGYSIVGSEKVSDYALKEAAFLVDTMLKQRKDVLAAMTNNGSRLIVMGYNEYTTDIPEYAHMRPKNYWDVRARGLGGSGKRDPVCSCGEENLLSYPGDPYSAESIFIHEFAHNIHLLGMSSIDPTFDDRLRAAYDRAMAQGLWHTKYASVNHAEYFAEGVQSWFNNNRPPDHDHNHVDTRQELIEYDPGLAKLCQEVFGDTVFKYTKAPARLRGHLAGYDPEAAPRFAWPKRLLTEQRRIREKARQRGKAKPSQKDSPPSQRSQQARPQDGPSDATAGKQQPRPPQQRKAQRKRAYPPKLPGAEAHVYKRIGDIELRLWVYRPRETRAKDRHGAIVFFFGGGWRAGTPQQFEHHCRRLASEGMVAITADYRVASRHGTKAIACVADAKSAIRWVREHAAELGVDPQRVAAGGGSAGGHIAACTGVVREFDEPSEDADVSSVPNALVLFNPALALASVNGRDPLGPSKAEAMPGRVGGNPQKISPVHHVRPHAPPTIIFHGKADKTVAYWTAEAFAKAMKANGNHCELKGYDNEGHGFFNYGRNGNVAYEATTAAMIKFLQQQKFITAR